mmetsp:Transcript_18186/g.36834  ORF Transcript_18186/g.36834 Transcript_18186/m.36834 type:complete len:285 (+) Transcript_18186:201-1055(+)
MARGQHLGPVRGLEDEAGAVPRHPHERGHPAARRADQPPRRQQRGLARELPHQPEDGHVAHHHARLWLPRPSGDAHHPLRGQPQAQELQGQPLCLCEARAARQDLLRAVGREHLVHVPGAGPARRHQVQGQGHHQDGELHLHLPGPRQAHGAQRDAAGVAVVACGGDRAERGRQVDHHQDVLRGVEAAGRDGVAAPEHAHRVRGAARVPPRGEPLGQDAQRVHPVAVQLRRGPRGAGAGRQEGDQGGGGQHAEGAHHPQRGRHGGEEGDRGAAVAAQGQADLRV